MDLMRLFLFLCSGLMFCACGSDVAKKSDPAPDVVGSVSARGVIQLSRSIGGELETIRSLEVMSPVAEKLKLEERWTMDSVEEAAKHLGKNVQLEPIRGTDLVEVRYIGVDAEFAVAAVNEIMGSYRAYQMGIVQADATAALEEMDREVRQLEKELEDSRALLIDATNQKVIRDGNAHAREPTEAEIASLRSILEALDGKQGDDLIHAALKAGLPSPTLTQRFPQLEATKVEALKLKASGLGDAHPKRLRVEKQLVLLEEMLVAAVEASRGGLQTKLRIFEGAHGSGETKDALGNHVRKSYEETKTKLAAAKKEVAVKRIELNSPQNPVQIHQRAEVEK